MKLGIVGLPNLGDMYHSKKVTPAVIEFVDIAGLVKGASKGEGLGNQFLSHIREVDAVVHVVRCFEDSNVVHVDGSIDPLRDIETIDLELIFSDLEVLERRIAKTGKAARMDKTLAGEAALLDALKAHLEAGKPARSFQAEDEDQEALLASYNLLTGKPVIFAANVGEDDLADDGAANEGVKAVREFASQNGSEVFVICAQIGQGRMRPGHGPLSWVPKRPRRRVRYIPTLRGDLSRQRWSIIRICSEKALLRQPEKKGW